MARIEVNGASIEYLDQGRGEPVVLLHSSGSSSAQWRSLIQQLSERYRVIAPDFYGYGGSAQWPGRSPFALESDAEIVLTLLERVGEHAHLVGHSYGGAVALHVAGTYGELLRSLTLIEPVAFHLLRESEAPVLAEITEVAESVVRAVTRGEYVEGFARFVDYWSGLGAVAEIPADKRLTMAARLPKIALDFHATLNEPTRLDDLRSIAVPTLLLHGTRSPLPTRRICELLGRAIPNAQVVPLYATGHMAPVTDRDLVNPMIAAHLDSYSRQLSGHPDITQTLAAGATNAALIAA